MKNNYNPFTVPDNFFEEAPKIALSRYRERRRAINCGIATLALVLAIAIPLYIRSSSNNIQSNETLSGSLAQVYEYDIFLQINCI